MPFFFHTAERAAETAEHAYIAPSQYLVSFERPLPDWIERPGYTHALRASLLGQEIPQEGPSRALTRVHLLWGAGGMGKSELARQFAYEHRHAFSCIQTFHYGDPFLLRSEYLTFAQKARLVVRDNDTWEQLREKVNHFLENDFRQPWLLILDNVEDPLGMGAIPQRGGSVLITSRDPYVWEGTREKQEVIPFSREEALTFLQEVTQEAPSSEMERLAEEFGYFPFALSQVAHFIEQVPGMTIARFRQEYQTAEHPLQADVSVNQRYHYVLQTVWNPSLQRVKQENPAAYNWLQLCAYFSPDGISEGLLLDWIEANYPQESSSVLRNRIVRILDRYRLLRVHTETQTLSLHRLLQKSLIAQPGQTFYPQAYAFLREGIARGKSRNFHTWDMASRYLPHARHLLALPETRQKKRDKEQVFLLREVAALMCAWGEEIEQALSYAIQAYDLLPDLAEEDRKEVQAGCLYGRAFCLLTLGRAQESLAYAQQGYACAPSRIEALQHIHLMGCAYKELALYTEAKQAFMQIIQELEPRLHPQSPWEDLNILAHAYEHMGTCQDDVREGIRWLVKLYNILQKYPQLREQVPLLWKRLPHRLGILFYKAEEYVEAEHLFQQHLDMVQALYRNDHPEWAAALLNMGMALCGQKRYEEAVSFLQQALDMQRRLFPSLHRDIALSLESLCQVHFEKGTPESLKEAARWGQESLDMWHTLYPDALPVDTVHLFNLLMGVAYKQGDWKATEAWCDQGLALLERIPDAETQESFREHEIALVASKAFFLRRRQLFGEALRYEERAQSLRKIREERKESGKNPFAG